MITAPSRPGRQIEKHNILTGEELFALGDIGPTELVKGEIVPTSPTGHPHGEIETTIASLLWNHVRKAKSGRVMSGEVGIYTGRNPDTVRAADVAFISNERMAQVKSRSYLDVAPDLVVEVMSPDDRWSAVMEKLAEYFEAGVLAVWIAEPSAKQVFVYRSLTDVEQLTPEDTLTGDDALSGFEVAISDLFE
jgi:Uma2 family endonuclease